MPPDLLPSLVQFGAAGLIGWMWLTERRAAAERERQLTELHDRLIQERQHLSVLLGIVSDNTRALTALESAQRATAAAIERLPLPEALPPPRSPRSGPGVGESRSD